MYILCFGYVYLTLDYCDASDFWWLALPCLLASFVTGIALVLILSDIISGGIVLTAWVIDAFLTRLFVTLTLLVGLLYHVKFLYFLVFNFLPQI